MWADGISIFVSQSFIERSRMKMMQSALIQQGYCTYPEAKLRSISNGLRFTPLVCMFLALYGLLVLHNPYWHFAIAALGIIPFWFPEHHPFDLLYNHVVRHVVKAEKLPANPLPRRIACVMGGLMNVGIGASFYFGNTTLAYVFGAVLIVLQLVVITTHICVASVMYEGLLKLIGKYEGPIAVAQAKALLDKGYALVDVRSPEEFRKGHIDGATNIPLDILAECGNLPQNGIIVYCASGMRSLDATQRLRRMGYTNAQNLGAMERWG